MTNLLKVQGVPTVQDVIDMLMSVKDKSLPVLCAIDEEVNGFTIPNWAAPQDRTDEEEQGPPRFVLLGTDKGQVLFEDVQEKKNLGEITVELFFATRELKLEAEKILQTVLDSGDYDASAHAIWMGEAEWLGPKMANVTLPPHETYRVTDELWEDHEERVEW